MIGTRPWILALVVTVVLSSSSTAQQLVTMMNGQAIGLLSDQRVQKELNLSDEQVAKSKAATDAATKRRSEIGREVRRLEQEKPGAGAEFMKLGRVVIAADYKKEISKFLKPEQMKRIREITIDRYEWRVFEDPDLRDDLKLTKEQRAKMDEILAGMQLQIGVISPRMSVAATRQSAMEEAVKLNQKTFKDLVAVLDDDQKVLWQGMLGPPSPQKLLERP